MFPRTAAPLAATRRVVLGEKPANLAAKTAEGIAEVLQVRHDTGDDW